MDEKLKWVYAAAGLGLVGTAVYQFLRETTRTSNRPRQPWDDL